MSIDTASRRAPVQAVGVPRRFGAGTLFIVVTTYAVVFRFLIGLGADWNVVGVIVLFTSGVAAGQALVFRGTKPREASILAGSFLCPLMVWVGVVFAGLNGGPPRLRVQVVAQLFGATLYLALAGALLGYVAGCSAASVFFVTDRIQRFRRARRRPGDDPPTAIGQSTASVHEPTFADRLWRGLLSVIRWLSPFQPGRPWREALNVFLVCAALMGPSVLLVPWVWQLRAAAIVAAVSLLVAFWHSGMRLARWRITLRFATLSILCALGSAILLGCVVVYGQPLAERIPLPVFLTLTVLAGSLVGLTASAAWGWLVWLAARRRTGALQAKGKVAIGLAVTMALVLFYATIDLGIIRLLRRTDQQVLAMVARRKGSAWNAAGTRWGQPTAIALDNATDADLELVCQLRGLTDLHLARSSISDAGLSCLATQPGLRHLDFSSTNVTGAGLRHLASSPSLRFLNLSSTKITDAGLEHLPRNLSVTFLWLSNTPITDRGLHKIRQLAGVTQLVLDNTQISDEGLTTVGQMDLVHLSLSNTQVSGKGLKHLRGLYRLTTLQLGGCDICDEDLPLLKALPPLQDLDLQHTKVTDAGLVHLQGMLTLRRLNLRGTRVTKAGVRRLEDSLPPSSDIESDVDEPWIND
jgi:Leucine-rich repeat (LRR) protein